MIFPSNEALSITFKTLAVTIPYISLFSISAGLLTSCFNV